MKKLLLTISICLLIAGNVFAANQWRGGTTEQTILGSSNAADIDANTYQKMVDPLDRLLTNYKKGANIEWASTSTLTVTAGEVVVQNAAGTIKLMVQNTTDTTVAWTEIDTGEEAGSTTYYVYAVVDATTDSTFRVEISTNSTTPDSETYYAKLGSFYNNVSSNIEQIKNYKTSQHMVSYGTVSNGGTIALPTGYDAEECAWIVSGYSIYGCGEDCAGGGPDQYYTSANASRVVTCYSSTTAGNVNGTCNYLITCFK